MQDIGYSSVGAHAGLARRLVLEHGWNSTAHQVLDPGMRHWFSAAGDAVVGYVEAAGRRVVAGAPVAADGRLAEVAQEFEKTSAAAGFAVCYFAAEDRLLAEAGHDRYASHVLGLQPIWSAENWASRFDARASLRAQRNRASNKGVRVAEVAATSEREPAPRACHAAWLASKGPPRLRFLAHSEPGERGEATSDRRMFVAVLDAPSGAPEPTDQRARGPGSDVVGYLMLAPVPRRRGWLVEKLVRHPAAPNGTAELLLDTALRASAAGSERFTLGLSPLAARHAGNADEPGWLRWAERLALRRGQRLYDFAGLHAFKSKFDPEAWEPVYLLSAEKRLSPLTFVAVACAFLRDPGAQITPSAARPKPAQRGWWSIPS